MDKKRRRAISLGVRHQLILASLAFAMAFSIIQLTTLVLGPRIEGRLFPVVNNVVIDDLRESTCGNCIIVTGTFDKLRECTFLDLLVVYRTPDGGEVGVPVRFTEGVLVRDTGVQEFGPWEIDLSPRQFEQSTIVEAYHQCHPFWVTVTRFYPPITDVL